MPSFYACAYAALASRRRRRRREQERPHRAHHGLGAPCPRGDESGHQPRDLREVETHRDDPPRLRAAPHRRGEERKRHAEQIQDAHRQHGACLCARTRSATAGSKRHHDENGGMD
jgi:hypothetical protein